MAPPVATVAPSAVSSSFLKDTQRVGHTVTGLLSQHRNKDEDLKFGLEFLFRENNVAKIVSVAGALLKEESVSMVLDSYCSWTNQNPFPGSPISFPESALQSGQNQGV
jgi:hypothetical protein